MRVPGSQGDDVENATDLVRVHRFTAIVAGAWGLFTALYLVAGPWVLGALHGTAFALVLTGTLLARRRPDLMRLGLNIVAGGSFGVLMLVALLTGGTRAPAMGYLALLPLVTGLFRRRTQRNVWLVLGIGGIGLVPVLEPFVPSSMRIPLEDASTLEVVSSMFLAFVLFRFGSEWRASSDAQAALLRARHQTIEEQAHALTDARDAALRASEQKSRFVAMTSHELRGPLNGILGMSDALSRTRLGDHQRELVRALSTSADSLSRLLSDLLDVARIEAGRLDVVLGPTDVRELLADVVDAFAPEAGKKGIDIAAICASSVPAFVEADAGRLGQVLRNLTSNAVKFTEVGSVVLEASRKDDRLVLSVIDTGKGIQEEHVSRIFAAFEQVSAELVDRRAGTGLGLWIARNLVESWGGTITVESTQGRGTMFHVSMPLDPVALEAGRSSLDQTARGLPRVLVITKRAVMARAFEAVGRDIAAQVEVRTSAEELLAHGAKGFRSVVVDIESCHPSLPSELAASALGERLVLAAGVARMADVEQMASASGARVLLLPVRASRLLHALEGPQGTEPLAPEITAQHPPSATMLVVDDDAINRLVARHAAEQLGMKVLEVDSGERAVPILETTKVDLVLLDLHLGGAQGDEVAKEIRKALGAAAPVLVAYTGSVQESDRRRLHDAGIQEILTKPLDRASFSSTIERALHAKRRRERASVSLKLDAFDPRALSELEAILEDPHEVDTMLETFLPTLEPRIAKVDAALSADALSTVVSEAHALTAIAATFGATVVSRVARQIENLGLSVESGAKDKSGLVGAVAELSAAGREAQVLLARELSARRARHQPAP